MGGPFGALKATDKPPLGYESKGAQITNISAQITFLCTCGGNGLPMVIHVIPGIDSQPTCPACKTKYKLKKWNFDDGPQTKLDLQVAAIKPAIIPV